MLSGPVNQQNLSYYYTGYVPVLLVQSSDYVGTIVFNAQEEIRQLKEKIISLEEKLDRLLKKLEEK